MSRSGNILKPIVQGFDTSCMAFGRIPRPLAGFRAVAGLATAALLCGLFVPGSDEIKNFIFTMATMAAFGTGFAKSNKRRRRAVTIEERHAWTLYATFCGVSFAAMVSEIAAYGLESFFAGADVLPLVSWLVMYVCAIAIPVRLGMRRLTSLGTGQVLLDCGVVASSLFVISWPVALHPLFEIQRKLGTHDAWSIVSAVTPFIWTAGDIALMTAVLVALRHKSGANKRLLRFFAAGALCMLCADTASASVTNDYQPAWMMALYFVSNVLMVCAAFTRSEPVSQLSEPETPTTFSVLAPYIPTFAALAFMAFRQLGHYGFDAPMMISAILMIGTVTGRQLMALFDNYALSTRLTLTVRELEASRAQLQYLAYKDALTSLDNRRYVDEYVDRRANLHGSIAAIYIDLNDFKKANDEHGHQVGDALLMEVARRLRTCARESDTVARLGGDEFVVLVENVDRRHVEHLAHRITESLGEEYRYGETTISMSASVGWAVQDIHESLRDMLRRSDVAMYTDKQRSRRDRQRELELRGP